MRCQAVCKALVDTVLQLWVGTLSLAFFASKQQPCGHMCPAASDGDGVLILSGPRPGLILQMKQLSIDPWNCPAELNTSMVSDSCSPDSTRLVPAFSKGLPTACAKKKVGTPPTQALVSSIVFRQLCHVLNGSCSGRNICKANKASGQLTRTLEAVSQEVRGMFGANGFDCFADVFTLLQMILVVISRSQGLDIHWCDSFQGQQNSAFYFCLHVNFHLLFSQAFYQRAHVWSCQQELLAELCELSVQAMLRSFGQCVLELKLGSQMLILEMHGAGCTLFVSLDNR